MNKGVIKVKTTKPPVVELDSSAHAAYVRFTKRKVCRTELIDDCKVFVTVDYASDGSVVGIELVGVSEFSIDALLVQSRVSAPKKFTKDTRYVTACA